MSGGPKSESSALSTSPLREMYHDIVTFFAETYDKVFGMPSPPMHDPISVFLVLAAVLDHSLAPQVADGTHQFGVFVVTDGDRHIDSVERKGPRTGNCGRTVLTRDGRGVVVPRRIDVDAFWAMIDLALEAAERVSPMKYGES
jgi:uridine nucleosidase